jgi:hypothetical protein
MADLLVRPSAPLPTKLRLPVAVRPVRHDFELGFVHRSNPLPGGLSRIVVSAAAAVTQIIA